MDGSSPGRATRPGGSWAPSRAASGFPAAQALLLFIRSQACSSPHSSLVAMHTIQRWEVPPACLLLWVQQHSGRECPCACKCADWTLRPPVPVWPPLEGSCLRCGYQHSCVGHQREERPKGHSRSWEPKSQARARSGHSPTKPLARLKERAVVQGWTLFQPHF